MSDREVEDREPALETGDNEQRSLMTSRSGEGESETTSSEGAQLLGSAVKPNEGLA